MDINLLNNKKQVMENQIKELAQQIENLEYTVSQLGTIFKCDVTQMNVSEAILELAFELKRYNDNKEKQLKNNK